MGLEWDGHDWGWGRVSEGRGKRRSQERRPSLCTHLQLVQSLKMKMMTTRGKRTVCCVPSCNGHFVCTSSDVHRTIIGWRATPLPPPFLTLIGTYIFRVKNPSLFATLTTSVRPSTDAVIDGIDSSLVFILFDLRIHALRLSRLSSVHASAHSLLA